MFWITLAKTYCFIWMFWTTLAHICINAAFFFNMKTCTREFSWVTAVSLQSDFDPEASSGHQQPTVERRRGWGCRNRVARGGRVRGRRHTDAAAERRKPSAFRPSIMLGERRRRFVPLVSVVCRVKCNDKFCALTIKDYSYIQLLNSAVIGQWLLLLWSANVFSHFHCDVKAVQNPYIHLILYVVFFYRSFFRSGATLKVVILPALVFDALMMRAGMTLPLQLLCTVCFGKYPLHKFCAHLNKVDHITYVHMQGK